jgi:Domain of unknown function (DUF4136)
MRIPFFVAVSSGALLCGCAATIPPVEVTRFHSGASIAPAAVRIQPLSGGDIQSLEFRTYAAAVGKQLSTLGFTDSADASSPYIAEVDFSRGTRTDLARRSPLTIGVGGGTGGGGFGIGLGTSIGIGGNKSRETIVTKLTVRIKTRADNHALWEGRAQTEAPSRAPSAQPGLAAEKLAAALFKGFPGQSGETITIP